MKATLKSMMVIGMMILGTVTSFANNNNEKNIDKHGNPALRTECHLRHFHDTNCGGAPIVNRATVHPGMNNKLHKHMLKGKHKFDKHGHCKTCHFTIHEIRRIERDLHAEHPHDRHHNVKHHHKHHHDTKHGNKAHHRGH